MVVKFKLDAVALSFLLLCSGCVSGGNTGRGTAQSAASNVRNHVKPAWTNADGKRSKFIYKYFPSSGIYYDVGRGLYFYYFDGLWTESIYIPPDISADMGDFVSLEIDSDTPYIYNEEVKKKYPGR